MEQFTLEKYLENPQRKVVTGKGENVRILCTDLKDCNYPVVAAVTEDIGDNRYCETIYRYSEFGDWLHSEKDYELFFAPQKQSRWVYLYNTQASDNGWIECVSIAYDNKDEAIRYMKEDDGYALTEITWEE